MMYVLKKIVAAFCAISVVATAFMLPISAETTVSFGLETGKTAPGTSGIGVNKKYNTSVVVTMDGLFESEDSFSTTADGKLIFLVPKGVFSSASAVNLGDDGLIGAYKGNSLSSLMANVASYPPDLPNQENADKYDILAVSYAGADGFTTMTGNVCEVKLVYSATSDFPAVEIIPFPAGSYINLCDENVEKTGQIANDGFVDMDYSYTIAAGSGTTASNVVTKEAISSDVAVTGVTLDQDAVELDLNLNGTKTATLVATVTPADATDPSVTWTSSNNDVATVVDGVVTAVAKGNATITAKAGDFSATCEVTVVDTTPATSGKGKVEIAEDAKDAAIWAWETAAVAGTKLAVTVTDGNEQRTKEFALNANVDATIKVGVIVQYDPTVYPLFDIVKVEVK